jgi:Ras-related protein Rab-8A
MTSKDFHFDYLLKLLLIGDSGCGKTSILLKYTTDSFSPTYISTIGIDFKIKMVTIGTDRIKLQVWDTAGQERFRTITTSYYKGSHGIFIVYDVTDRGTFNNITNWLSELDRHAPLNITKILIGNKVDSANRAVTTQEGKALSDKYNIPFFETSAKTGINITESFEKLINTTLKKHKETMNPNPNPNIVRVIVPNPNKPPLSKCC